MDKAIRLLVHAAAASVCAAGILHAQGRGGAEWTTAQGDAQRSSWVRSDAKVSSANLQKFGGFQFLWKMKLHNEPKQLNSLTQPVLLDRLVGFRGFKAIAVVGASADTMYAVDYDVAKPLWTAVLNYSADNAIPPSTWNCPGGLMAAATRPTSPAPPAFGGGGGGGGRGGRSGGSVGEPGRGAPNLALAGQGRGAAPGGAPGQPGQPARAGGGGGGGRGGAPQVMGLTDAFYAMGSDGFVHALNVSNGADLFPPVKFLPENSKPSALLLVQQDFDANGAAEAAMLYTSTSGGCGATPNGVWAIDLASKDPDPIVWKTNGGSVVGSAGPTLGTSGRLFAAVGKGTGGHSDSVVALDAKTLELKDWITVPGADFNSSPTVFRYNNKEYVAVTGNDGKLYLLDGTSLGGANHATPLYASPKFSAPIASSALSTWESAGAPPPAPPAAGAPAAPPTTSSGTRWILAPYSGALPTGMKIASNGLAPTGGILAFKLVDQAGKLELQPTWSSRDMVSPMPPLVVNNVVFALSSGESRSTSTSAAQRAKASTPAVLYALDGLTGKELWNSGKQITSFARSGLAAGGTNGSQVFVTTFDSTLYAFGFPMER
jgi:hypothetical protein